MSEKHEMVHAQAQAIQVQGGQYPLEALERMAHYIVRSGLFGVKREEEAVALLLLAQAEGLHPMRAVQEYHIIQGRPALRADAMLARFLQAGGRVEWHELSNEAAEATFIHPQGGRVRIRWTLEDAKRAGLLDKAGDMWRKYPRAMLRARVVSEGVRTVYPGVVVGLYAPEEVVDIPPAEPQPVAARVVDAETGEILDAPAQPAPEEKEVTAKQLKLLAVLMRQVGLGREEAHRYVSALLGREIGSAKELSKEEASRVIDHLQELSSWFDALEVPEDLRREVMADAARHGDVFDSQETLQAVVEGYKAM